MLRVFIGFDPRQPVAFTVLSHSIMTRASKPVEIIRLQLNQLPMERKGLTEFTFSRYLVPYLENYVGRSIFMDADMLCLGDVYELYDLAGVVPVSVVKNKIRFEWPSLMVFNNPMCRALSLEFVDSPYSQPQTFNWAKEVGELPSDWNHLVGYDPERNDAKLVHFTAGIPCWPETKDCEYSDAWRQEAKNCMSTVSWEALMGKSVHRKMVMG